MPKVKTGGITIGDPLAVRYRRRLLRYTEDAQRQRERCSVSFQFVRRHVFGMSKRQCAEVCGVSRKTVDRWEDSGSDSLPDIGHIGQLCAHKGLDYDDMRIVFGLLH